MKLRRCDGCGKTLHERLTRDWMAGELPFADTTIDVCSARCLGTVARVLHPKPEEPAAELVAAGEVPHHEHAEIVGRWAWDAAALRHHAASIELDPAGEA